VSDPLSVFFLTSEVTPVAKTGGLADVSSSLPRALKELLGEGIDLRIGTVAFRGVEKLEGFAMSKTFVARTPAGVRTVRVFEGRLGKTDVPIYAVDPGGLFDRPGLYGENGIEYEDNLERFALWNHALLHLPSVMGFLPDILHANDWQTALSIPLLPHIIRPRHWKKPIRTILSIHNMAFQGVYLLDHWKWTGLPHSYNNFDGLEFHGRFSLLKGGIQFADFITTVSPSYRDEVLSEPGGHGLSGALRHRQNAFVGLLNGIDAEEWSPSIDRFLPVRYSAKEIERKETLKQHMKGVWGLDPSQDRPLFGVVSRMATQKGLDVLAQALLLFEKNLELASDWIVLGAGEPELEEIWRKVGETFQGRVRVQIGFDESMSHQIMGASDFLLVPSIYEPCGLTQMYAMRYGTLPIVNPTGGLRDTVIPGRTGLWIDELSVQGILRALSEAEKIFNDRAGIRAMRIHAMDLDSSWRERAGEYFQLYRSLLSRPAYHNPPSAEPFRPPIASIVWER
jgi:starch synthase